MLSMSINEFTNVLSFIWTFFNDLAVVLEEMINEELIELLRWTIGIFIDSSG
jgi:hypothetical protein